MIYFLETELNDEKPLYCSLMSVYGINKFTALKLCKKLGFSKNYKTKALSENQITQLLKTVQMSQLIINDELRKANSSSFESLIGIKSYRGLRRLKGFPVRGQRTHTNAKTSRKIKKH